MQSTGSIRDSEAPEANPRAARAALADIAANRPGEVRVIRRNGKVTPFDASKISVAMTKAFLAVEGGTAAASARVHELVARLSTDVVKAVTRNLPGGGTVHIEDIQDQVELALMRAGEQKVARSYVLYRERRTQERAAKNAARKPGGQAEPALEVSLTNG
ncbi:MAG: ATP cone domain-containing protein, partial [Gammaproteobacteria bacterium]|nr:ATP cone domain-containing protein [Gammaproteobacteria bacterium]